MSWTDAKHTEQALLDWTPVRWTQEMSRILPGLLTFPECHVLISFSKHDHNEKRIQVITWNPAAVDVNPANVVVDEGASSGERCCNQCNIVTGKTSKRKQEVDMTTWRDSHSGFNDVCYSKSKFMFPTDFE